MRAHRTHGTALARPPLGSLFPVLGGELHRAQDAVELLEAELLLQFPGVDAVVHLDGRPYASLYLIQTETPDAWRQTRLDSVDPGLYLLTEFGNGTNPRMASVRKLLTNELARVIEAIPTLLSCLIDMDPRQILDTWRVIQTTNALNGCTSLVTQLSDATRSFPT